MVVLIVLRLDQISADRLEGSSVWTCDGPAPVRSRVTHHGGSTGHQVLRLLIVELCQHVFALLLLNVPISVKIAMKRKTILTRELRM